MERYYRILRQRNEVAGKLAGLAVNGSLPPVARLIRKSNHLAPLQIDGLGLEEELVSEERR